MYPSIGGGSPKQPAGIKHDDDKPRMALLSTYALTETAKVLNYGAQKYGADNWRAGISARRLISAALRHILAFNDGEDNDPETGLSHLAHAMCMIMFELESHVTHPELDDRYKAPQTLSEGFRVYTDWLADLSYKAYGDTVPVPPAIGTRVEVVETYERGPRVGARGTVMRDAGITREYRYTVEFDAPFPAGNAIRGNRVGWNFSTLSGETDKITIRPVGS